MARSYHDEVLIAEKDTFADFALSWSWRRDHTGLSMKLNPVSGEDGDWCSDAADCPRCFGLLVSLRVGTMKTTDQHSEGQK